MCYVIKVFKGKNLFNVQNSPLYFNGTEDNKFINGFRFFTVTNFREVIFCFTWESKETEIPKIILKKRDRREFIQSDSKTYYRASAIMTVQF